MMLRQFQKIKKIFLLEDNLRTKTDLSMCIILYYQNYQDFQYFKFFYSNLPPSQGGRYSGFGYSPNPPPRSQSEYNFDGAWSSLSSVS